MTTNDAQSITLVSGLPRSGTSMMMQMLVAGGMPVLTDELREADEDNASGYYELEAVKRSREDVSWVSQAPGKAVKTIYMVLKYLPAEFSYKVVFMRRRLGEVLDSQQVMLERRGQPGAGVAPDTMAGIFQKQLDETERWLAEQPNFEVIYINYHDVVGDSATEAQRIADFLGGGLDVAAMQQAVQPTMYRQRNAK